MDKHISLARELGYEGQELRDYLKRQQDLEREERLAQREYEKEKREAEQKDKEREQKDKEREQKDKDREQKEKDRELEKMKIEAACKDKELEKLKIEAARKDKEMEMEKEIALKKIEAEVELKKIEAETTSHPWGPKEKSSNPRSPKLPYFDEHTDKMDSYLTRFESYALSNKWDPSMWASYLSALLKGRALEVFVIGFPEMTSRIMVRLRRLCLLISTSLKDLFVRNLGIVGPRKPKLSDNLAVGYPYGKAVSL